MKREENDHTVRWKIKRKKKKREFCESSFEERSDNSQFSFQNTRPRRY